MEFIKLEPSALSDPGGAGADELIKLLNRLSSQFEDLLRKSGSYGNPLDVAVTDLRKNEFSQIFANQMRKGDVVLYILSARDEDCKSKFFFNRDGSMRLVIKEELPDLPRGRGARMTWDRGIQEIYSVMRFLCIYQAKILLKAAKHLKPAT